MIGKRTLNDEKLALITFTGPLSKTQEVLEEVSDFVSSSDKLEADGNPTLIFYTAPLKDEGRYDVGIPVKGDSEGDGKIRVVTIPGHTVIFTEYSEDREEAYRRLIEYVEENRLDVIGAPREVLHGDVREIQFPVVL